MRALNLILLLLPVLCSCGREDEEPETTNGRRPTETETTVTPSDNIEQRLKDVTEVSISYDNFFHKFSIRTLVASVLPEHIVDFGIKHADNLYAIGENQVASFSSYQIGDTLSVDMETPFWHAFRTDILFNPDKFYDSEDAYYANDSITLRALEAEVIGLYKPKPIAVVDSALIIDLSTKSITGHYFIRQR